MPTLGLRSAFRKGEFDKNTKYSILDSQESYTLGYTEIDRIIILKERGFENKMRIELILVGE
jgi:hypothetical protein